jgi:chromosome segregation ATPase
MPLKLSDHKERLGDAYETFKAEMKALEDRIKAAETERDTFKTQATEASTKVTDLEKKLGAVDKTVDERVRAAEAERDTFKAQAEQMRGQHEALTRDFDGHKLDVDIWETAREKGLRRRAFLSHLDRASVKRGADGKLEGVDDALEALKASMPETFGEAAPPAVPPVTDHGRGVKPPATPPGAGGAEDIRSIVAKGLQATGAVPAAPATTH